VKTGGRYARIGADHVTGFMAGLMFGDGGGKK